MPKSLTDFIKENQKYIKLDDGDTFSGTYIGSKVVPNKWDRPEDGSTPKDTVEYWFEQDGRKMSWTCGSMAVATQMIKLKKNEQVQITRVGKGPKTVYAIVSDSIRAAKKLEKKSKPEEEFNDSIEPTNDDEVPF